MVMANGAERIAVIIGRTRHKMVVAELQDAAERGVALIELRLDFLAKAVDFKRLLPEKKCPWIATIRRREDGGRWTASEAERLTLLRQAIVGNCFDWVDLEHDIAGKIPRFGPVKRIVSYHNLDETPADLEKIYEEMLKLDADVYKLAVMAQSPLDNVRIFRLLKSAPKPTVAHCMGDLGSFSRVLSLKFGAPFVYAAYNPERTIAPGLLSYEELRRTYPLEVIGRNTKVFAVLGDPVGHSLSPLLHNSLYRKSGIDAVYVPIRLPREHFAAALKAFDEIPIEGYSVTIPLKELAAGAASELKESAKLSGAANTLVRTATGWAAANTDMPAVLGSLENSVPRGEDGLEIPWPGREVLILGAGGAARAVAHGLRAKGAAVTIASRTMPRAEKLAAEVEGVAVDWASRHQDKCSMVVNCTPVGMHPNLDESPLKPGFFKPGMVVFDSVYNPENTLMIKDAKSRGCQSVSGVEMFARQAALQHQAFTGREADLETLKKTVRQALSPVTLKHARED